RHIDTLDHTSFTYRVARRNNCRDSVRKSSTIEPAAHKVMHMATDAMRTSDDILVFWFDTLKPADWFRKSTKLDGTISSRFTVTHAAARAGELHAWRDRPTGRLAEIIVLDQFSRNIFRDMPLAFAQDA